MSDRYQDFLSKLASHRQIADIKRALDASAAFGVKAASIKSDKDLSIEGRTNKSKAQAHHVGNWQNMSKHASMQTTAESQGTSIWTLANKHSAAAKKTIRHSQRRAR